MLFFHDHRDINSKLFMDSGTWKTEPIVYRVIYTRVSLRVKQDKNSLGETYKINGICVSGYLSAFILCLKEGSFRCCHIFVILLLVPETSSVTGKIGLPIRGTVSSIFILSISLDRSKIGTIILFCGRGGSSFILLKIIRNFYFHFDYLL